MNEKTTVLYVIGSLDVGGAERQLVELARRIDRVRFTPVVCCLTHAGRLADELRNAGVCVVVISLPRLRSRRALSIPGALVRFIRLIRAESPQVIHGFLFHAYVLGALGARLAGVRTVVASRRSLSVFKARRPGYRLFEQIANSVTDVVVANSDAVRQDALRTERLPPDKVVVIPNGVHIEPLATAEQIEARKHALGIPPASLVVTVVANFIHYKGHEFFFSAWAVIHERYPSAVALLVGDGPLRRFYEAEIIASDLGSSAMFLGTRLDVPALLRVTDVLVHPSLEEGFSNTLLEAMAAGKPVVATAVGGNPEAVIDGQTGLLVPPRDAGALAAATCRLLADAPERARFGANGRTRVQERFSMERMVEQYEHLYRDLVAGRSAQVTTRGDDRVRHRRSG